MSRTISINNRSFQTIGVFGLGAKAKRRTEINSKILSMREKKTKKIYAETKAVSKLGSASYVFALIFAVISAGAFYLYQVNDLATKGYEIKEIENRINELQKESKKMKIKEVELRSMYNIEKATENLDLVNASNVSYLEMNSPVAMNAK